MPCGGPRRQNHGARLHRVPRRHGRGDQSSHPRTNPRGSQQVPPLLQQDRKSGNDERALRENPEENHQTLPLQVKIR